MGGATTAKRGMDPTQIRLAHTVDLATFERLREMEEFSGQRPLWAPSECRRCSDQFKRPATGIEPGTKSDPCSLCSGSRYGPQYRVLTTTADEILVGGARGGGKALPYDTETKVVTPKGWKLFKDLKPGDVITDPTTGGTQRVLGVFPQGRKLAYRVTCDDGSTVRACEEHLWSFRVSNRKRPGTKRSAQRDFASEYLGAEITPTRWTTLRVGSTAEMIGALASGFGVRIPLAEPTLFTSNRSGRSKIDHYILGLYLGDGHLPSLRITNSDPDVRAYLLANGFEAHEHEWNSLRPVLPAVRKSLDTWLRNHGLRQARSWEKFVPAHLFTAPLDQRLDFVQGLLDTDGTVDKRGRVYFNSASEALARGLRELIWSLGGKCSIQRKPSHYTKDGERHGARDSYQLRIWVRKSSALFRRSSKKARCTDVWNGGSELTREVVSIEPDGEVEMGCITVSGAYGLFLTNDYIVTHNSDAAKMFLAKGNPHLPLYDEDGQPILVNHSYFYHPAYRAVIIRKNAKDLDAFVDSARALFRHYRGKYVKSSGSVGTFEFESGAKVWTGHLDDANSFEKYIGMPELHRIVVEELTFIPEEEIFLRVLSSMRSVHPELIPQQLGSTNPAGRGVQWVKNRYVKVRKPDGSFYKPNELIEYEYEHPLDKAKKIKRTRVFIPATVHDNPHLDDWYLGALLQMSEKDRRVYLDGDWDSLEGAFFDNFRSPLSQNLPFSGEPERACHVITKKKGYPQLHPWDARAMGGDWGFAHESAFYWLARQQSTQQVIVYRELVASRTSAEELGMRLAYASLDDLNEIPDRRLTLWFSPEAVRKKREADEGRASFAELLAYGVSKVLGSEHISMPDITPPTEEDIHNQAFRAGWREFASALHERKKYGIEIRAANDNRQFGWHQLYSSMLWDDPTEGENPLLPVGNFDEKVYQNLSREFGPDAARRYKSAYEKTNKVYPELQILECCPRLIEAIPLAQHDEKNPEDVDKKHFKGMDSLDAWRYGFLGLTESPLSIPAEAQRAMAIEAFKQQKPNWTLDDLMALNRAMDEQTEKEVAYAKLGRRASSRRHLLRAADRREDTCFRT